MGEFADSIRVQAATVLKNLARQPCAPEADPVIELISHLVEPETNDYRVQEGEFAATDEWIRWSRLIATRPRAVTTAVTATLEWERPHLPHDMPMMQVWAARLVLSTLDRFALT